MKKTYTLTKEEIAEAILEYLQKSGEKPTGKVVFEVAVEYDYYDRPIGHKLKSATVECEVK